VSQGEQRKVSWRGKHYRFRDIWREPIHGTAFHGFNMDNRKIRRSFVNTASSSSSSSQFIRSISFKKLA
jgi:hypothetical protein